MAIDIGAGANGYGSASLLAGYTALDKTNPANETGIITTFEIMHYTVGVGVKIGTFAGNGTSWSYRDHELVGNVPAGSKQVFSGLNCSVSSADIIGWYAASGQLDVGASYGSGYLSYNADYFSSGTHTYTLNDADGRLGLYGLSPSAFIPQIIMF
jgi:hypothetical protein